MEQCQLWTKQMLFNCTAYKCFKLAFPQNYSLIKILRDSKCESLMLYFSRKKFVCVVLWSYRGYCLTLILFKVSGKAGSYSNTREYYWIYTLLQFQCKCVVVKTYQNFLLKSVLTARFELKESYVLFLDISVTIQIACTSWSWWHISCVFR